MLLGTFVYIKKTFLLICGIILIVITAAVSVSDAGETIKIGGTGSGLGVMKILGEAFEKKHPGTKVQVLPSLGSTGGIKGVAKGVLDIAVSSRFLNDSEKGLGLSALECARSPFIMVTRKDTRSTGLTTEELVKIYEGRVLTWPDGSRLRVVLRPAEDTDTHIIKGLSTQMEKAVEAAMSRKGMLLGVTDQDATRIIEKTPGALGFSTLGQVTSEKLPLKVLSLDGVFPTGSALLEGVYKLNKSLCIVTGTTPSAVSADFLDFVRSPAGTKIFEASGYVVPKQKTGQ